MKDYGITLSSYALYDEQANRDYMVYEVKYADGHKEYVSRKLFNILNDLLNTQMK